MNWTSLAKASLAAVVLSVLVDGVGAGDGRRAEGADAPETGETAQMREITVGPAGADVVGFDNRAIQIAIDAAAHRGGGVVRLLGGQYVCIDSVRLRPHVHLVGERETTILRRAPLVFRRLAVDADRSETEITPVDSAPFRAGMGVCVYDAASGWMHITRPVTIKAVREGVLHLDGHLSGDRSAEKKGLVANLFPLILGVEAHNATVEGVTADGAVSVHPLQVPHNATATIYFWRSRSVVLRDVASINGLGDGIWLSSSSTGALVERCTAANNTNYGIHFGSHSTRPTVRGCDIHGNAFDGLYLCWGIRHSKLTDNTIHHNGWSGYRSGISVGHKDTDALVANNHIHHNAKYGVCVREKTPANSPHRLTIRDNLIENNGSAANQLRQIKDRIPPWESIGCGVQVSGMVTDVTLAGNTIRDTRPRDQATQRHAIALAEGVGKVVIEDNSISGCSGEAVLDDRN